MIIDKKKFSTKTREFKVLFFFFCSLFWKFISIDYNCMYDNGGDDDDNTLSEFVNQIGGELK